MRNTKGLKLATAGILLTLVVTGCSSLGTSPGKNKQNNTTTNTATGTTKPSTKLTATSKNTTKPQGTTTPAKTTTPATTKAPSSTTGLKPFAEYMKLNNDAKSWSHGYPVDLSKYDGAYKYKGNSIYLTFDLGYEAGYTKSTLDTLKKKGVKAIFFLTGTYIEENKALVNRMKAEGHLIGNHGYNHKDMAKLTKNSPEALIEDLKKWDKAYGGTTKLYRAPEGVYSERGMAILKDLGYKNLFWGAAYEDWIVAKQPEKTKALKEIKERTEAGEIVLLHPMKTNSEILPDYIDWVKSKGWDFKLP